MASMALLGTPMRATARGVRRHLFSHAAPFRPSSQSVPFTRPASSFQTRGFKRVLSIRAGADDSTDKPADKPPEEWDIAGLKAEARRAGDRTTKKVAKATTKLRQAKELVAVLESDPEVLLEKLEKCPDVLIIEAELEELKERATSVYKLNEQLGSIKSSNDAKMSSVVASAIALHIGDTPPPRAPRGPKQPKGKQPSGPRMPYFTYTSSDSVEIRVGRKSEDNDELSCNPEHRADDEWWMHVSGCPGSHVVIRFTENDPPKETLLDAAVLAFENSKASKQSKGSVSLVRCRQVSKPLGAKSGLVRLNGNVASVNVSRKDVTERLERLMKTKK